MYSDGLGVKQDYEQAAKYFHLAAEQGNVTAQFNLGVYYRYGYGIKQNYKKALSYYQLAAEQGNIIAQYNLGVIYI
ncbi:hypothetical protein BGI40_07390 [Snodgrassella communis]|uniref:Beta-lactamase n=2 Tax=Snodgrassella communis TaxID=2946699 RepID=A0A066TN86_9NEIS|nr:hypothetical protein SALWKB12_0378 [Snodgrassella communis]KDN15816.1 hypothetical protein SALWKB29_0235 [Snodgrassella communis]PIT12002.1 hypothetical protein BGI29_02890 [Snodgrassella communis]PIT28986.1 hypothetical protein BGI39_04405 [Snodgrassella communis]PIT29953.1 hypothetical protein BGI38_02330 [Snodgrassella communis]